MIKGYNNIVEKLSKGLENIAAIILFITAMLIIVNVVSRSLFIPIAGTLDLVLFFTTLLIALSVAYCAVRDGHIYISILVDRFPKKVQKVIDTIIGTTSAVFLFCVAWQIVLYANSLRVIGEVSLTIRLPHFPFVWFLALGIGVLALVVAGKVLSLFTKEGEQ